MATAVFPGSFDPVTIGHMDLIKRALAIFDKLVIGVLANSAKNPFFTEEERVYMLKELTKDMPGTEVIQFNGLLVDFVKETKADAVIRGIRNSIDFEYELPLAQANYKLDYKADTIFLATLPEHSYISSSAVRELVRYKGDIKGFVPDVVYQFIVQKFDYMI
ncbi:MAG: pantetheine-phosphate adenylyltransferase [Lachnospiraceae bacterium]|mgnify:CR=1 FL=1|jgi:pantetheine-phosphate adenylyltransferase, bacterial|nr:pantetheine-phosphate adenylyltransferase [Lachnospiraceae bacterium]